MSSQNPPMHATPDVSSNLIGSQIQLKNKQNQCRLVPSMKISEIITIQTHLYRGTYVTLRYPQNSGAQSF